MDLYQKQQFGFFLQTATERYVSRLEERFRGADSALAKINEDCEGEGVWLTRFTEAVFEDFLLNNIEGACFVLQALANRRLSSKSCESSDSVTVEEALVVMAKQLFAELLLQKTVESLEQHSGYQSV